VHGPPLFGAFEVTERGDFTCDVTTFSAFHMEVKVERRTKKPRLPGIPFQLKE